MQCMLSQLKHKPVVGNAGEVQGGTDGECGQGEACNTVQHVSQTGTPGKADQ